MAPRAIISYDDTPGDHDALIVGRILSDAGALLTLAYVRHCTSNDCSQEELEEQEAERLLAHGADRLTGLDVDTRVVISPSTPDGLRRLVSELRADIVVFGSDYRTPPGRVAPQHTTRSLLECGPAAVAIAPAEYFGARIHRIGVISIPGDDTTIETARALADSYGATLTRDERQVDMLVVGSRLEAPLGHVLVSSQAQNEIENANCPVLVVPRGVSLDFPAVLAHAA